jgi:putative toxin-antitoxin system antitoxin component (TIGR02293 family)
MADNCLRKKEVNMATALAELLEHRVSLENLARAVRSGIPRRFVDDLAGTLGMQPYALAPILRTSDRTLRRYAPDQLLPSDISEKALQIARVLERAIEVLETEEHAVGWLTDHNSALGAVPLQLLDSAFGAEQVLDVLGRIEDTVYS